MGNVKKKTRRLAIGLGSLQAFIGIGGVAGGVGLISDPSGANLGMTVEWLAKSPFSDFLIPGIVLFMINGIGSLLGSVASFLRFRRSGEIAILLGTFLVLWIIAQLMWLEFHWLHPVYLSFGLIELIMGFLLRKSLRQV